MTADPPRRRRLSDTEHELWRGVTRSVAPLKRKRARAAKLAQAALAECEQAASLTPEKKPKPASTRPTAAPARVAVAPKAPPPLLRIDRRTKQRIARGSVEIDARLDLHGRTQAEAHGALLRFLHRAQGDGLKTVLVITGKGSGDFTRERGVLKRQVPLWLGLPEFRIYVIGVEDAHVGHGGEGALYVRLRRGR
jgi:DNA-nicking Smr family endonuclease